MAGKKATISVNLIADATKARAGFKQAEDAAGALDQQFKNVAKTAAAAFGTAQVIRFGKDAVGAASDLAESMNAVNVTFEDAADGILKLGENAADTVGLSAQQFNQFAVEFAGFTKQIADSDAEIVSLTDDLTVRIADFASVMNLDVPQAATVFRQALSGETEGVKRFGIDLSAAAVQSYALANGITDSASAMTESEKVLARYELLMESTEQMSGDFANTSDGLANSQRILKADLENLKATVGEAMVPALEALMGAITPVVDAFMLLPEGVQQAATLAGVAAIGFKSASTSLQGFGVAAKTANTALGVLGVALYAGTTLLNAYSTAKAESERISSSFRQALDSEAQGVERATDAFVTGELTTGRLGEAIAALGLDVRDVADYIQGDAVPALNDFMTVTDKYGDSAEAGRIIIRELGLSTEATAADIAIAEREIAKLRNGFDTATREASRFNDAMTEQTGIIGDVDDSAKYLLPTVEDVTAAIAVGTGAVEEHTEAQTEFEESLQATREAMFGLSEEFQILMGQFDNDDAIAKMDEALTDVIETVAEFGEESAEAEQAIRDFADDVENTITTLGNVPTSVTTQIAMAISDRDLQRVDSLLNYYAELARVTAGTITSDEFFQSFGGELGVGGGSFNPDIAGPGTPVTGSVSMGYAGAAAGMVNNVTVNAGMGTDGDEVARQIVEVLNDFSAGGGAKLDANVVAT